MRKKKVTTNKPFDVASLQVEEGITITPRSEEATELYKKLDELTVGQSYKMPASVLRIFTNARVAHKRISKKIFIFRRIDKFNIRCWRIADGTILSTRRKNKAKK